LIGSPSAVPDYDGNSGVIIFDRADIVLRRLLCENFDYYNISGTYTSTEIPADDPSASYLEELSLDLLVPNDTLEFTIDECTGFDDAGIPSQRMHPYYMYFGIRQGQSSLDKLRKNYFDRCID
jgi:hypothetical protein